MRKFLLILAATLAPSFVYAGNTQVSSGYKAAGRTGYVYGRSDGIFQNSTTYSPTVIENGTAVSPLGKGFYETFGYGASKGITCEDSGGLGACGGNTSLVPCTCTVGSGLRFVWMPLTTEDLTPVMVAGGLDIGADQTNNDGAEVIFGIGEASGRPFIVGDDPAFYFCATMTVADASGIDANQIGFVEVGVSEAWNADFEARNSYAGVGLTGTASSGNAYAAVYTRTEDDGAGVVATDTTDTASEAVAHKYCTYVSATGAVTYKVDNATPTTTVAFTFDDGIAVVPYTTYLHTADVAGTITFSLMEAGYQ